VHGPKQRKEWIDPALSMAQSGSSLCIEGPPGVGKRTLARLAAATREGAGEIFTVDGRTEVKAATVAGARPSTWLVLDVDRLPRPVQLEIAHAVGRATGVTVIATCTQPLDRALADGRVAPWFASLFSGKRVAIPSLDARREDIPGIVSDICERRGIDKGRLTPEFLEALVRAGWPGGVPQLEAVIGTAAEASAEGPLSLQPIAESLSRPTRIKPTLPPASDPALARARIEDALARANGSVASAARSLGMSRQAIYREADRLGLDIARRKLARS
jgi:DNA-binding NtrC family response regulator